MIRATRPGRSSRTNHIRGRIDKKGERPHPVPGEPPRPYCKGGCSSDRIQGRALVGACTCARTLAHARQHAHTARHMHASVRTHTRGPLGVILGALWSVFEPLRVLLGCSWGLLGSTKMVPGESRRQGRVLLISKTDSKMVPGCSSP